MRHRYRLRVLDMADNRVGCFDLATCRDDPEAIAAAILDFPQNALDLWDGDRLVRIFLRAGGGAALSHQWRQA